MQSCLWQMICHTCAGWGSEVIVVLRLVECAVGDVVVDVGVALEKFLCFEEVVKSVAVGIWETQHVTRIG